MSLDVVDFILSVLYTYVTDIRFQIALVLFLILWILRSPTRKKDPVNKAVLITGCDTGMGHRMARHLDTLGMHVFAGCLDPDGTGARTLGHTCSERLRVVPLDVTRDRQVREAVEYVKRNLPTGQEGLYCLINNSGVCALAALDLMTCNMVEEVIDVNITGTIRVTKHFLPLIEKMPGRIVTITSILARLVYPQVSVYVATKHALDGFFLALRLELREKGVHVATVEPGDFSQTTDIGQWTRRHLNAMWDNLTEEERKSKRHLYESTKKRAHKSKCSEQEQERHYRTLLRDVEHAVLSDPPCWRYVSDGVATRAALWVFRMLPERWACHLMAMADI